MAYLLGIDLGTSSLKTAVVEASRLRVLASASREYLIQQPFPGDAEQNPEDWWRALIDTVRRAVAQAAIDPGAISGIGFSGQMHGVVCLDETLRPLRPAIIWADTRSAPQVAALEARLSRNDIARYAPGRPAAGWMGPSLMWLAEHEPETLARTQQIIMPKDYVRLRMTGQAAAEISDAGSTWLLDIKSGQWSGWLVEQCGLEMRYLPPLLRSEQFAGELLPAAAAELGLPAGIAVAAGCADQPAQALGYGLVEPGIDLVTIGTGGQVFHPLAQPAVDPNLRLHTYPHAAPGRWYAQAAILAGGLSLRWLRDVLGLAQREDAYTHLSALAAPVALGADGLLFLPYLAGERTPHMDPQASGAFLGLRLHHTTGHLARAVMEGVALAMADCLERVAALTEGASHSAIIITGGASNSAVWRQIQADVYARSVSLATGEHQACVGAALLAGVASGAFTSVTEAAGRIPGPAEVIEPDPQRSAFYRERLALHREMYPLLHGAMHRLAAR
ncbi:MAG: xylulokinase [Anaerolineae bacterium]|nr:xylulokinase [Anaerolineae bacterium]